MAEGQHIRANMVIMLLAYKVVYVKLLVNGLAKNRNANKIVKNIYNKKEINNKLMCPIPFCIVYCLTPPVIEHARHSAIPEQETFDLDHIVQYHCHTGYVTKGFPRAKCIGIDGTANWYGPDIQCERKKRYNIK